MHKFYAAVCFGTLAVMLWLNIPTAVADPVPCRRVVHYTPPHVEKVIVVKEHVNEVIVEKRVKELVNADFYFSVGDEYREEAFARLVAKHYVELTRQQQPPQQQQPPPAVGGIVQQPPGVPPIAAAGDGGNVPPECKPVITELPPGFKELVIGKCQKCHTVGVAKERLDLTDLKHLTALPLSVRDRMFRSVSNGRMPKGGKITDDELGLFNAYATFAETLVYGAPKSQIPKAANPK